MRMDKLTSRFQAALADAQSLCVGRDHQFIEPAHVLLSLLDSQGGGIAPLLRKAGAEVFLASPGEGVARYVAPLRPSSTLLSEKTLTRAVLGAVIELRTIGSALTALMIS